MSYISLLCALFKSAGSELTGAAWWNLYLNNLVVVEQWFLSFSWWIVGAVVAIALIIGVLSLLGKSTEGFSVSATLGCFAIFLLLLPLFEWITLLLAQGMAASVDPTGVVNQGKLIMSVLLYLLLGAG